MPARPTCGLYPTVTRQTSVYIAKRVKAEHLRPEHLDPLTDVALHKSRYFASGWAHYDTAKPGTLKLVPPRFRWAALAQDYATMRPMFMTAPPPFADLMRQLAQAEQALNLLKGAAA